MPIIVKFTPLTLHAPKVWSVQQFLSLVEAALGEIPAEWRQDAKFEFDYDFEELPSLSITYRRPETDDDRRFKDS